MLKKIDFGFTYNKQGFCPFVVVDGLCFTKSNGIGVGRDRVFKLLQVCIAKADVVVDIGLVAWEWVIFERIFEIF